MLAQGELLPARETMVNDIARWIDWRLSHGELPHPEVKILINNKNVTDFLHVLFEQIGPKVGLSMVYGTIAEAYYDFWAASGIRVNVEILPFLAKPGGYLRLPSSVNTEYFIEPPIT